MSITRRDNPTGTKTGASQIPAVDFGAIKSVQNFRLAVQTGFMLLCIWIGVEFYFFVRYLETEGISGSAYRPPGVEGFLPISSLMSLYHLFLASEIHPAHPAGLFILVAVILMSLVVGKSFCSWVCPIGFLSEAVGDLSEKLFRRRISLPKFLDYPLRSLKYLLLGFFAYSIFFLMTPASLRMFLDSSYNIVADVKMYYFFADISQFALTVIAVLLALSVLVRGFWCRYLCPYGALLGLLSLISLHKIRRNESHCVDCGECATACPSRIKVNLVKSVLSDECTSCMRCVDACQEEGALEVRFAPAKKAIGKNVVPIIIVGTFLLVIVIGKISGSWQNSVSTEEYLYHQKQLNSYGHPTGAGEISDLNEISNQAESKSAPSREDSSDGRSED